MDLIVEGGQSMNPSTEDLLRAVETAAAPSVIVLPNNSNVIMTAEQTVGLTDREVVVVPTRSIQAGLAAAWRSTSAGRGAENAREMRGGHRRGRRGEITRAVRDSLVDGVQIEGGRLHRAWSTTGRGRPAAELEPVVATWWRRISSTAAGSC